MAVLKAMADAGGHIYEDKITGLAARLNATMLKMQYYWDILLERELVRRMVTHVEITAKGRRFLVEKGLL
jgi:predicted transcriptional regulator